MYMYSAVHEHVAGTTYLATPGTGTALVLGTCAMAQAGGGGGGGWGAPNGGGGGWGTPNPNAPNLANVFRYRVWNADQVPLPFVVPAANADGSTNGWTGRGWGEHCDDEPGEILGGGWVPRSLDDLWIPGGRLWQGPLQRGEDDSFRGYQR